jgi:hypothetical protein
MYSCDRFSESRIQKDIFPTLDMFTNLTTITLSNGRVSDDIHNSITRLLHLRELRFIECFISSVDRSWHPEGDRPFTVKALVLVNVEFHPFDYHSTSASHLAVFPLTLLAGLISVEYSSLYISPSFPRLLADTPHLEHLTMHWGPQWALTTTRPELPLPSLLSFRGPAHFAAGAIPSASRITELCVSNPLMREEALNILDTVHPHEIRNLELTLIEWEPEILEAISLKFIQCKRLKLTYWDSPPTTASPRIIEKIIPEVFLERSSRYWLEQIMSHATTRYILAVGPLFVNLHDTKYTLCARPPSFDS